MVSGTTFTDISVDCNKIVLEELSLDSTFVKVHRHGLGAKKRATTSASSVMKIYKKIVDQLNHRPRFIVREIENF